MYPRRFAVAMIATFMLLGSPLAAEDAAPAPAPAPDWYAPLKGIPLGPGKLDVGMSFRLRFESYNNYNVLHFTPGKDDRFLIERTRLSFDYHLSDDLHLFVEGQDDHFWLSRFSLPDFGQSCPLQDDMDLHQAYLEWKHIGGTPFGFKIGRQAIGYGDEHVFTPSNWGNTGRYWWDAGKLYFDTDFVSIDVFAADRIITLPERFDEDHFPFDLYAVYAQFKKLPFKLDLFYTFYNDDHNNTKGESGTGDRRTQGVGAYIDGNAGKIDYRGTIAHEFGEFGKDDIDAWGINARAGYTFDLPWSPRVGLEYTLGTGDKDPHDGKHQTFDGLFGTTDPFFGRMDMFSWQNLQDYQATFGVKPTKDLDVWLDYHLFRLDQAKDAWYFASLKPERQDVTGKSGSSLGQEIDLSAKWKLNKNTEIQAGYGHFFPGSFLKNTKGGAASADWVFMQVMYSF